MIDLPWLRKRGLFFKYQSINQLLLLLLLKEEKAVLSPIQIGLLNFIDWLQFSCYFFLTTKTTTTMQQIKNKTQNKAKTTNNDFPSSQ